MSEARIQYVLALKFIEGVPARLIRTALEEKVASGSSLVALLQRALQPATKSALSEALGAARHELDAARKAGVAIVALGDRRYPALLRAIPDPPPFLFVKGTLPRGQCVAIAGTREPSDTALQRVNDLVDGLSSDPVTIVSGLARGIDTVAHKRALEVNLATIAVLGGGLNRISPKENGVLSDRIVERGGCLISEQLMDAPTRAAGLVARDRIQSGMSLATVIVESELKGGSMYTAAFCLRQGRWLFAFAPQSTDERWSGNALLLDRGGAVQDRRFARFKQAGKPLARALKRSGAAHVVLSALQEEPVNVMRVDLKGGGKQTDLFSRGNS